MNTYHYHVIFQISITVYKRTSPLTTRFCCLEFPNSFLWRATRWDQRLPNLVGRISFTTAGFEPAITSMLVNIQVWNTQSDHLNHIYDLLNYVLVFFKGIDVCWETCSSLSSLVSISPHKGEHEICSVQNHPKTCRNIKDPMNLSDKSLCSDQPMGFWKTMSQSPWFEPVRRKSTQKGNCPQYPKTGINNSMKHVCTST